MRSWVVVILVGLSVTLPCVPAGAIGLPAGTTFQVVAEATYLDSEGTLYNAEPAWVTLTVQQVAGVSVEAGGPVANAVPGQDLYIPFRVVNLGNGVDSFTLAAGSSQGWNVAVVYDDNGDGIHQPTEQYVISTAGPAVADGYSPCFARVSVPQNATSGGTVTVVAVSDYDPVAADDIQFPLQVPSAPSVVITGPTADAAISVTTATIDIAGTASGGLPIVKIEWATDHGAAGVCAGTWSWTAAGIPLQRGSNVVTVTATDSAGRTATDSLAVNYVDAVPPSVVITSPTSGATYTTDSPVLSVSGTASDDVGVVSVTWSNGRGGSGTCTGTTSWSVTGIVLAEGENVITVTASDAAGNTATDTLTVTYQPPQQPEDKTPPSVMITSPTDQDECARNCAGVTLAGTASDNAWVVSVTWSNAATGKLGQCALSGEAWSASGIELAPGENVITVTAADGSGNEASDVVTITWIDAAPGSAWTGLAMVSLPIIPDETDPKAEIPSLGDYWCTYITNTRSYAVYPDALTWLDPPEKTPGRGFWAYFESQPGVPCGTIPPQDQPAVIPLKAGWNLIGTPFISDVVWDVSELKVKGTDGSVRSLADASDLIAGYAWGWRQDPKNPATGAYYLVYDSSLVPGVENRLEPWRAYWVKAAKDCDLIIPPP